MSNLTLFTSLSVAGGVVNDPWKQVAARTKWLQTSASTAQDRRGAFVGIAFRFPEQILVNPIGLNLALQSERFAPGLLQVLASWGVIEANVGNVSNDD